jgi:hypothetical protein
MAFYSQLASLGGPLDHAAKAIGRKWRPALANEHER